MDSGIAHVEPLSDEEITRERAEQAYYLARQEKETVRMARASAIQLATQIVGPGDWQKVILAARDILVFLENG